MSVTREEDRQKNGCSSRGFGIAAAAIGVGVGAALYYFFSKRAEHPNTEGSTSEWNCEQTLHKMNPSDDSYTTVSEYDTSDTSIYNRSLTNTIEDSLTDSLDLDRTISDFDDFFDNSSSYSSSSSRSSPYTSDIMSEDSDLSEFDVTSSSIGIPEHTDMLQGMSLIENNILWVPRVSPNRKRNELTEAEQMAMIRQEQFRERSWTLEECSICFEVMLRNQEVTRLPCAHNFHTECIMPWLQEKQTCPNCRKLAE